MWSRSVRRSIVLVCTIICGFSAEPLWAWAGEEHVAIGKHGYAIACVELQERVMKSGDPAAMERYALVCSAVAGQQHSLDSSPMPTYGYASLAGEWSALAADHTQSPHQLTDIELGDIAIDYRVMTKTAVTNYRHFHPVSVTSWRSDHFQSLEEAAFAATKSGIPMVEAFEKAMAVQAFAQHYLQDSFASGHMGFNRVGSSNAAALSYHDAASIRRPVCG